MRTKMILPVAALLLLAAVPMGQSAGETQPCAPYDPSPPFTDYCYHQGVWYVLDTTQVDVLILPPAGPYALQDIQMAAESLDMWDAGLHALGGPALDGLTIDSYTVGLDAIPESALADPEVIVTLTTETQPFALVGLATLHPINFCHGIQASTATWDQVPGFHQHAGSPFGSFVASCSSGGKMCYVINTGFTGLLGLPTADTGRTMFDLISHEVGHCLSLGHVGDADTESTDDSLAYPHHDIMSYENDGLIAPRSHCVSNLDAQTVTKAFSSMLAPPGTTAIAPAPAAYVHMQPASYSQPTCPASTASWTNVGYVLGADPAGLGVSAAALPVVPALAADLAALVGPLTL